MNSVSSFVCPALFAITFRRKLFTLQEGVRFTAPGMVALLAILNVAVLAGGQTAHFDGAQVSSVASGGSNILAIAVDAKGDVYFTAQNGYLAAQGQRATHYVPAAVRSQSARHLSDGEFAADALKMNTSTCTYIGPGNGLFVQLANSNTLSNLSGLNAPMGLALDSSGDLYVLDASTGAIYEYLAANGSVPVTATPSMITLVQGNNCAGGEMAMGANGNLYYTTMSGNTVEEILAAGGVIPLSPTTIGLGSGFNFPAGIAVDSSGNLYVANAANNTVEEIVAVNGSIPASPTIETLGSGFNSPAGLAVDSRGDVYVSDFSNNLLKVMLAVNGSVQSSPTIETLGTYSATEAVAIDGSGDIYIGGVVSNSGNLIELTPSGNFGQVNVGTSAPVIPMSFTFDSGGTLGGFSVLTQGTPGLDYTDAGSGTCNTTTNYSAGQTCTVNVSFMPKFNGPRNGAVVLTASNGNVIATGYIQGTGLGPQVNFLPGTQSTVPTSAISAPSGVAVDGSGSIYVLDSGLGRVLKETPSAGGYTESTVANLNDIHGAYGLALDGSGAVYVADTGNDRVVKETPTANGYSETTIASGLGYPESVAVDGSGSVYFPSNVGLIKETPSAGGYIASTIISRVPVSYGFVVDASGNLYLANPDGTPVLKETLSGGVYTQSTLPWSGQYGSTGIAVDGMGNVYIVSGFDVLKDTLSAGSYTLSTLLTVPISPGGLFGIAVDSSGNLYITDAGNNQVLKEDFAQPILNFANTSVGTTSADSPQTLTVENAGSATLTFPILGTGNNPSIGPDFTLDNSGVSDCPIINSDSANPVTLAPGASCELSVSFTPTVSGPLAETLVFTDNNLNATAPNYSSQAVALNGTVTTPSFTIGSELQSFEVPQGVSVSSTITVTQQPGFNVPVTLSASGLPSGVTAVFSPNPATGMSTLTLTASDTATIGSGVATITGTFGSQTSSITVQYKVTAEPVFYIYPSQQSVPLLSGAEYSSAILSVSIGAGLGRSVNLSASGLPAGVTVTFSPTSTTTTSTVTIAADTSVAPGSYTITLVGTNGNLPAATANVTLTVMEVPAITWPAPVPISYGTALSAAQLNASANVPGTFSYSPAAGTMLGVGTQTLNVIFTPSDTTDYITARALRLLTVNQATPAITWSAPIPITYGTALGVTQLNATSTVAGTFSYAPAAGSVLPAGTQSLTTTFIPTDATDYTTAQDSVAFTVNKAMPQITWNAPAEISYGTALSAAQLNASAKVPGVFVYLPAAGTVLPAGTQTLSVTFTPSDTVDYSAATSTVPLTVNMATQSIAFAPPASIAYGASPFALTATASSGLPVTFALISGPATLSGNILTISGVGTVQLTATQPGSANYQAAPPVSTSIVVTKGAPSVSWPGPAPIIYGTALSSTQLDAASTVAGTFAYTPLAGKVLAVGTQTLSVIFTPSDLTDYAKVTATVQLIVQQATPKITWSNPAAINYGKALSSTQLNAKASASGTFVYAPPSGTVLDAGAYTLTAAFTPTNTANYTTASASVQLTVNQASQTINFSRPSSPVSHTSPPITLTATASSGLSVNFTVQSGPATVSGNTLTFTGGKGTVVIVASQPGDSDYRSATPVSRSITVN